MRDRVNEVVGKLGTDRGQLLEILGALQQGRNYLTREELTSVAIAMDLTPADVFGTATFYSLYSTKPRGKYVIRICENAPCHVDGAAAVLRAVQEHFRLALGTTTDDTQFTLETTSCLGVCSVAPAMMINDRVYGNLTPETAVHIIENLAQGESK